MRSADAANEAWMARTSRVFGGQLVQVWSLRRPSTPTRRPSVVVSAVSSSVDRLCGSICALSDARAVTADARVQSAPFGTTMNCQRSLGSVTCVFIGTCCDTEA